MTTNLDDVVHKPFGGDDDDPKPWCRPCTEHYAVGREWPCAYATATEIDAHDRRRRQACVRRAEARR